MGDHQIKFALSDRLALVGIPLFVGLGVGFGMIPAKYLDFIPESCRLGVAIAAFAIAGLSLLYLLYHVGRDNIAWRRVFYGLIALLAAAAMIWMLNDRPITIRLVCGAILGALVAGVVPLLYSPPKAADAPPSPPSAPPPAALRPPPSPPTDPSPPTSGAGGVGAERMPDGAVRAGSGGDGQCLGGGGGGGGGLQVHPDGSIGDYALDNT